MKYLLFVIGLVYNGVSCSSQVIEQPESCKCDLSSYTLSEPDIPARIALKPDGFEVMKLQFPYGEDNENSFFFFEVSQCQEGWLKIFVEDARSYYWIEPKRLATTGREFGFKLYSSPKGKELIYSSKQGGFLTILGCDGKWALVEFKTEGGKVIKGWIAPEDQCPTPYTTCN